MPCMPGQNRKVQRHVTADCAVHTPMPSHTPCWVAGPHALPACCSQVQTSEHHAKVQGLS